jgi:hypothetical protein
MNDKIDYTLSYVAYLDVLGFTEMVMNEDGESKKRLASYFDQVDELTKYFEDLHLKDKIKIITISDSIIMSLPINSDFESFFGNLRQLCVAVGIF